MKLILGWRFQARMSIGIRDKERIMVVIERKIPATHKKHHNMLSGVQIGQRGVYKVIQLG